jgi:hypothetical protein
MEPYNTQVNTNSIGEDDAVMEPRGKQKSADARVNGSLPALIHNLEELRSCVLSRLDSIEELARRRSGAPSAEITRLKQALEQKTEELKLERSRLRAEVECEESSWKRSLAQLENDQQLLTEAWERLERERIDTIGAGSGARPAPPVHHPRLAEDAGAHRPPSPQTSPGRETGNPVAETILRQFQTLCSDVRRTTDARLSPR